jgi:hypothetical protein
MSDNPERAAKREALRQEMIAAHRAAMEAEIEAPDFHDEGYDETLPGQEEIVAGTVEHAKVLSAYHNASSYGPDVNVVIPEPAEEPEAGGAPTVVDVPYVEQSGDMLNCTMGNWTGEPTSYTYEWSVDGSIVADASGPSLSVAAEDAGKSAHCIVTATNATGSTAAPPSNDVIILGVQR